MPKKKTNKTASKKFKVRKSGSPRNGGLEPPTTSHNLRNWRLKIVCSFKVSSKPRPKVSVYVFLWLLFFSHVLNSFTVANLQRFL